MVETAGNDKHSNLRTLVKSLVVEALGAGDRNIFAYSDKDFIQRRLSAWIAKSGGLCYKTFCGGTHDFDVIIEQYVLGTNAGKQLY